MAAKEKAGGEGGAALLKENLCAKRREQNRAYCWEELRGGARQ